MNHLILGGTGTVGGAVGSANCWPRAKRSACCRGLKRRSRHRPIGPLGWSATSPTRSHLRCAIFAGSDSIFLLIANSITETFEALSALNEAKKQGYKKIVYMSVQNPEDGFHIAHFGAKWVIEEARQSGIRYAILQPSNFYQNDFWFKDTILQHGIYPQPLGDIGVSRVDVRDIAEAAYNCLTSDKYDGKTFELVGPDPLTGDDCAKILSKVLGREIKYSGHDMNAWYEQWFMVAPPGRPVVEGK